MKNTNKLDAIIIDDNADIAMLLEHAVKKAGFHTTLSNSSEIAMNLFKAYKYDLILTDWMMPNFSGLELIRWIRAQKNFEESYIIMITAKQGVESLEKALEEGADDYLTKPITLGELYARINVAKRVILLRKEREKYIQKLFELNQKMKKNLISGLNAQKMLLPPEKIEFPELIFSSFSNPAEFLSGDNHDFIRLSDEIYLLFHLDMCGHGVASALYGITVKTLIGNMSSDFLKANGVKNVLQKLNTKFYESIGGGQYFTLVLILFDFTKNELLYISAGHSGLYIIDKDKDIKQADSTAPPIGLFEKYESASVTLSMDKVEKIFVISDGVSEARNSNNEFLGEDKVLKAIEHTKNSSIEEQVNYIKNIAYKWTGGKNFSDDLSIIGVKIIEK